MIKIFLLMSLLNAAVIKHDVSSPVFKDFDYAEVCELMGAKNAVLITPKSLAEIECLNKNYKLTDFCAKKFPEEKNLARGLIDPEKKKAVCEFSDSVTVTISCVDNHQKYCVNSKKSCEALKEVYAKRLEIAHHSVVENSLNCYFIKQSGEKLDEL